MSATTVSMAFDAESRPVHYSTASFEPRKVTYSADIRTFLQEAGISTDEAKSMESEGVLPALIRECVGYSLNEAAFNTIDLGEVDTEPIKTYLARLFIAVEMLLGRLPGGATFSLYPSGRDVDGALILPTIITATNGMGLADKVAVKNAYQAVTHECYPDAHAYVFQEEQDGDFYMLRSTAGGIKTT